jgi:hypothetical protein
LRTLAKPIQYELLREEIDARLWTGGASLLVA